MKTIKTILFIAGLLILISPVARAADWSPEHKTVFTILTVLNVADIAQTTYIYNHPEEFKEGNPLMTKEAYLPLMVGANILIWWMADKYEDRRSAILYPFAILKGLVVARNASMGVGFSFSF